MYEISGAWCWYWRGLMLLSAGLFLTAAMLSALCVRRRHGGLFAAGLGLSLISYLLLQSTLTLENINSHDSGRALVISVCRMIFRLPRWVMPLVLLALTGAVLTLGRTLRRRARGTITPMSIHEALNDLPMGLCAWLPGGQVVLVNHRMQALCRAVTGKPLVSGELLWRTLQEGDLVQGEILRRDEQTLLRLPDGTVFALTVQTADYDGKPLTILQAAEITEVWRKTQALEQSREQLSALNRRLVEYNREIVDLTAQEEILRARVRLHDQMGEDLLRMRILMRGNAAPAEAEELRSRLLRNVSFLKSDTETPPLDEAELMLQTARRLGVTVELRGELPRTEPQRHIVATGIHECFTNLLRHARGDTLRLTLREDESGLNAVFSGNGAAPEGPIREKGGLRSLRELTEQAGGRMEIELSPALSVRLTIPKEAYHGL